MLGLSVALWTATLGSGAFVDHEIANGLLKAPIAMTESASAADPVTTPAADHHVRGRDHLTG